MGGTVEPRRARCSTTNQETHTTHARHQHSSHHRQPDQRSRAASRLARRTSAGCASPSTSRVRNSATGEWGERANYFDVTVWGTQGETCEQYLSKGRGVAVDGRLRWREFETEGQKRQAVEIVAEHVKFLGGGNGATTRLRAGAGSADIPADAGEFVPASVSDDDIPF